MKITPEMVEVGRKLMREYEAQQRAAREEMKRKRERAWRTLAPARKVAV